MAKLLFNSLQLLFRVPKPNTAIARSCYKLVCIDGMKLSVVNGICMAFCFFLLLDPHVAFDCEEISCSVSVQECYLFSTVKNHQMRTCRVKAEVSDGVSSKRLDDSETIHVFVHSVKVPKPHMIIQSSSGHSMAFGIDGDTWNTFCMAFDSGKLIDRNTQWFERNLFIILLCIIILVIIVFFHLWFLQLLRLLELNFFIFRWRLLKDNFCWTDHFSINFFKSLLL